MSKKFNIPVDNNILSIPIEEAMPDNYLPYAVEVAKDRALPDVRDGLKPVHRRILYGAYKLKALPDRPYLKSARIVGDILGKYHPHGDASVYDAMVLLAQDFATRVPLIDGHGNWGSVDGDNAAAMRYTEARLADVSLEMLRDIEKDVVDMVDNYSASEKEPEVLPARYPNLLVNGSFGIAVGLATNIPPHNLGEVIDGVLALSDNENITTKELMEHIKGPDLPTGGKLIGINSIESAYQSGKGKVTLRSKTKIETLENGRLGIVITEFPYRKNKAKILQTISEMTGDKKHAKALEAITDIRDESDRNGIRAVIEFKKSIDKDAADKVLKYLFKKTELQCNLSFNMVALVNGKPETMGLKTILYHYLQHQKEVITRRTKRELEIAEKRYHIVEGFIKAISIMDEVIKTIRASKSKKDAQNNLVSEFGFTDMQAEAILELMLYRLTGLEIKTFEKEHRELEKIIERLRKILSSEKELIKVVKKEITEIKEKYADERRTEIVEDESKAVIDVEELIIVEDTVVTLSNEGFIKRIATKSYNRSTGAVEDIEYREGDYNKYLFDSNTKDIIMVFTDEGNMYQIRGIDIPECKWKEKGERIDSIIKGLDLAKEKIIGVYSIDNIIAQKQFMFFTNRGSALKVDLGKFNNSYTKLSAVKLKKDEKVIEVLLLSSNRAEAFIKFNTIEGLEFVVEEPRLNSSERNASASEIIKICHKDEVIKAELCEQYEYKTFPVSVNSKGVINTNWGRDEALRVYADSAYIINIFTSEGKVYNIPAYMIQNVGEKGINFSSLVDDYDSKDKIISVKSSNNHEEDMSVYTITKNGIIRKTKLEEFTGKYIDAIEHKLKEDDILVGVDYIKENEEKDLILVTQKGMCIRFDSGSVNLMKRTAAGVTGISLKEDDQVIFAGLIEKEENDSLIEIAIGEESNKEKVSKLVVVPNKGEKQEINVSSLNAQNRAGRGKNIIYMDMDDYIKQVKIKKK